ncbi:hypothetical protein [Ideonella sp.]|jgi:hypothetical protein|uniref:hypothetical protein n=1 Tax=Ideonella sp. TaxID=1929293 RepID=UPI0037BECA48
MNPTSYRQNIMNGLPNGQGANWQNYGAVNANYAPQYQQVTNLTRAAMGESEQQQQLIRSQIARQQEQSIRYNMDNSRAIFNQNQEAIKSDQAAAQQARDKKQQNDIQTMITAEQDTRNGLLTKAAKDVAQKASQ